MPIITVPVGQSGAIIEVLIGVSHQRRAALEQAGQPVPAPFVARGLIDTGASSTCVGPQVIQSLQLCPTGTNPIYTPSTGNTPHLTNVYDVSFTYAHYTSLSHALLPVMESDLHAQGIDCLIGRDALEPCIVVYDGPHDLCHLCF